MTSTERLFNMLIIGIALVGQIHAQDAAQEFVPHKVFMQRAAAANSRELLARPGTRARNAEALEEMRRHILTMYEGMDVNHSFVLDGQHFDCVPINQQPSVRLLGLKLEPRPPDSLLSSEPALNGAAPVSQQLGPAEQVDQFGNSTRCEDATIPMKRITLEEMSRFEDLRGFFAKDLGRAQSDAGPQKPLLLFGADHEWVQALEHINNLGGQSVLSVASPYVDPDPSRVNMTLSQQWYVGVNANGVQQTAEAGWNIQPNFQINTALTCGGISCEGQGPWLFVYWTADNYQKTGCYNLTCAGFVWTSNAWYPGAHLPKGELMIHYQLVNGAWWLALNRQWVGYLPISVYNGGQMSRYAQYIEFGGEVATYSVPGTTTVWPPMGTGAWGSSGYSGGAAYQRQLYYYDLSGNGIRPVLTAIQSAPRCYTISGPAYSTEYAIPNDLNSIWGWYFFFGGPGGSGCL